ncbi:MAG TPA: DUF1993 domain-containing protein [Methylibium sp.]|nr:DUF1993 domain-containing protein [Methylibium sp.]
MSHPLYLASIPVFRQFLGSLAAILAKAESHAEARKIDPEALLGARLFPDMFPLRRQVQLACDFAKNVPARLSGTPLMPFEDSERSFGELQVRIGRSLALVEGYGPERFEGSESRAITITPGGTELHFAGGSDYLHRFGMPNFMFHLTSAYAILRHNGVELGKRDFIGPL